MNASRMRRLGGTHRDVLLVLDESRPVTATARVVRDAARLRVDHFRQLVGVRALQLREAAVLEDGPRERVVLGQLLQHLFVHRRRARRRLLDRLQLHALEEDVAELLGRGEVELPARELVRALLQLHLLPQLVTLAQEHLRIDEDAVPPP